MFKIEENKIILEKNKEQVGFIEFIYLDPKTVDIIHTFIDKAHRGKGLAKVLIEYALSYFKEKGLVVKYSCSYVKNKQEKSKKT